jgi:hypothetical protein
LVSTAIFRNFVSDYKANMMNFFKMNLFEAALTPDLRRVIAQEEQKNMTIKKMYRIATSVQRESKENKKLAISARSKMWTSTMNKSLMNLTWQL